MSKKLIAGFMAALMALVTAVSPVLATTALEDYPGVLGVDGELDAYVVVGEDAATADVVGAIDLAVRLAELSYREVTVGEAVVAGAYAKDLDLADGLNDTDNFGSTLKQHHIAGLQDTQITIDIGTVDNEYDVHDEIRFTNLIAVETGLTGTVASQDEDFEEDVFIAAMANSISYYYVFDDTLKTGNYINDSTQSEPIEIGFLDGTLTITGATSTSITVQIGREVSMYVGDTESVAGKTVTLENVGSTGSVVVDVSGEVGTTSTSKTINGIEVKVIDTFYSETLSERMAILILGEDAQKTYTSGDAYVGEDESDPDWVWVLSGLKTTSPTIGIEYDQNIDDPGDNPAEIGECYSLPGDFVQVCLDSLSAQDYQDYEMTDTTEELYNSTGNGVLSSSANVIVLRSLSGTDDGFMISTKETDEIALEINTTASATLGVNVYWQDPDDGNKFKLIYSDQNDLSSSEITLRYQDSMPELEVTTWNATVTALQMNLTLKGTTTDVIYYFIEDGTTNKFTYVGHSDGDTTTANDILYGTKDISGWQEDTRTPDGLIISDPDANAAGDDYKISLPEVYGTEFEAKIIVSGPGAEVTAAGETEHVIVGITIPIAVLDTEVTSTHKAKNLVTIGSCAVNTISYEVMVPEDQQADYPYPVYGYQWAEVGIPIEAEGTALVGIYDSPWTTGKIVVLAAGWSADDTRTASTVLQQYELLEDITESEALVTEATTAGITAV